MNVLLDDGMTFNRVGGIARYTRLLHRSLQRSGVNVAIARKPLFRGPRIYRRLSYIFWVNTVMRRTIMNADYDIVHFTNYLTPFSKTPASKVIVTIHDMVAWKLPWTLPKSYIYYLRHAIKRALLSADAVITVSETIRRELRDIMNYQGKVYVVPNMLAPEFSQELFPKAEPCEMISFREKMGIEPEAKVITYVGALEYRKNILTLLKAYSRLSDYIGDRDQVFLSLIGNPGPGFPKIKEFIQGYRPAMPWKMYSSLSDELLRNMYDISDMIVLPSYYEGFGLPIIEAWARGVPVILSDIPVFREVAGEAGLYFPPQDEYALASAIGYLISSMDIREKMVANGYRKLQNYTMEQVGRQLIQVYKDIADDNDLKG